MAMTLDELRGLLDEEGIKYFLSPNRPAVMAGFKGMFGSYKVLMSLQVEGTFLQFRSQGYLTCEGGHDSLDEVLKVIGELNYSTRLVKLGWDPSDGEIVAYADMWLMDNQLTLEQLKRIIGNYMPTIDIAYKRLEETIDTGRDPGEVDPETMLKEIIGKFGKDDDDDEEKEPRKVETL